MHKTDKDPIYGLRGVVRLFKEKQDFYLKEKGTHEKTYVFSHALCSYIGKPPAFS